MGRTCLSVLFAAALLTACGSTPRSNYYMLSAEAEGVPGNSGPSVGVGPVTIPSYLDTRKIVLSRSNHRLTLAEFDRWAEPIDAGVKRVVAFNLAVLMDTQNVRTFPWQRNSTPEYAVRIAILELIVRDTSASLIAEYSILQPGTGETLSQHLRRFTARADEGKPETVAVAYSRLLLDLSEAIAETIGDAGPESRGSGAAQDD